MADFDWVTARSACSLATIFEQLKMQLQADVDKRNALRQDFENHYGFKMVANGNKASVMVQGNSIYDSVLFHMREADIVVVDKSNKVKFIATPTLCDDGECRLKVNGQEQERELWQVRKMALEDLFFRAY